MAKLSRDLNFSEDFRTAGIYTSREYLPYLRAAWVEIFANAQPLRLVGAKDSTIAVQSESGFRPDVFESGFRRSGYERLDDTGAAVHCRLGFAKERRQSYPDSDQYWTPVITKPQTAENRAEVVIGLAGLPLIPDVSLNIVNGAVCRVDNSYDGFGVDDSYVGSIRVDSMGSSLDLSKSLNPNLHVEGSLDAKSLLLAPGRTLAWAGEDILAKIASIKISKVALGDIADLKSLGFQLWSEGDPVIGLVRGTTKDGENFTLRTSLETACGHGPRLSWDDESTKNRAARQRLEALLSKDALLRGSDFLECSLPAPRHELPNSFGLP